MSITTRLLLLVVVGFFLTVKRARCLKYCDNNCKNGDGNFCVADDPAAYSVCLGGHRVGTMRCQTGLNWDEDMGLCNWPQSITATCLCGATTSTVPTTPAITTTMTPYTGPTRPPSPPGLKRICYLTNWAIYRPKPAGYSASMVDPFMCTHIIVAFMKLAQGKISYQETADPDTLANLTKLRDEKNPALKILVAVGGWNAGSWPFTEVVKSNATMDAFVTQSITFLRQHDLDGLDIDWEYPQGQISQYSTWMQKLRDAFENEAAQTRRNRLLLMAAVAAGQQNIDYAYNVPKLSKAVDFINLMSYDLNGAWNPTTGLNAGLNPQGGEPFNVKWCSDYWVAKGADPQKLVIGIPTYGRTFRLCNPGPTQTGIGAKACGAGNAGTYTQSAGFEAYYESCLKLQCSSNKWTSVWNEAGQAPYMYSGDQWITYENQASIAAKVLYVKSKGYGGVMVWTLDLDDFNDICGYGVKSPLMKTLVAIATGQPVPKLNATPKPAVNPCDGASSGGAGGGSNANLDLCDNKCAKDGFYCVPDNPQAYYYCNGGTRSPLQYCQSTLQYHYLTQGCDWPENYPGCICNGTKIVATTTTLKTTTTAAVTTTTTLPLTNPVTQAVVTRPPSSSGFQRICYLTNWAVYRPGAAYYSAGMVDPFMCTHIIVAFMSLSGGKMSYLEAGDGSTLTTLTKMRNEKNPALKILVAIGGWNAGSWPFVEVVKSTETMDVFINQAITFLRQNNVDGLDIDWEYPQGQVEPFSIWMQKMRDAFELEAAQTGKTRLLLTAAVAAGQATIDTAYDIPKLSKAVDYLNLMSYDLNGAWNPTTGLNAGLNPQSATDPFNVKWCSEYWVQKGADPQKLIIGIPTYGRTFKLCNPGPTQTGIGAKACGTGNSGPYTQSAGFEAYYESCLKQQCTADANWTSVWSEAGQAPFMYAGNQWISYENTASIAAKVLYAKTQGYGGVMVWTLDLDDFQDICGYGVKSPLMKTLVAAATDQPIPQLNAVPKPLVKPCAYSGPNPNGGASSGGGDDGSLTSGTNADLDLCDNKCAKDGLYCVPDNPQAYYQCLGGTRYPLQYCQTALRYHYVYQACDWPANYPGCNCKIANTTTTTTTAKPFSKRMFKHLIHRRPNYF